MLSVIVLELEQRDQFMLCGLGDVSERTLVFFFRLDADFLKPSQ